MTLPYQPIVCILVLSSEMVIMDTCHPFHDCTCTNTSAACDIVQQANEYLQFEDVSVDLVTIASGAFHCCHLQQALLGNGAAPVLDCAVCCAWSP